MVFRNGQSTVGGPKRTKMDLSGQNGPEWFRWIQEGFKGGFLQKHLNPIRVSFRGDSVRILGGCPAVTLTFGL